MQNIEPRMRDPGQLTDLEVKKNKHDLEYMRRRHLWAYHGQLLPLVHTFQRDLDGSKRIASLLYAIKTEQYIFVPDLNIFEFDPKTASETQQWAEKARYGKDELLISLILEGWLVD
jgi:hypothetical protein